MLAHLLLSSSAVEAQCCLRRRSPCVHRRQRCRGPSLLALKKCLADAGALAAITQSCRGPVLLAPKMPMRPSTAALSRPLVARAEEASGCCWRRRNSTPNAIVKENCRRCPRRRFRRRLPCYHTKGPASLAEQISPEHGCSLLLLVPLLQSDTSFPLLFTRPRIAAPLSTRTTRRGLGSRPVDVDAGAPPQHGPLHVTAS
jgi:hypothetical protein